MRFACPRSLSPRRRRPRHSAPYGVTRRGCRGAACHVRLALPCLRGRRPSSYITSEDMFESQDALRRGASEAEGYAPSAHAKLVKSLLLFRPGGPSFSGRHVGSRCGCRESWAYVDVVGRVSRAISDRGESVRAYVGCLLNNCVVVSSGRVSGRVSGQNKEVQCGGEIKHRGWW